MDEHCRTTHRLHLLRSLRYWRKDPLRSGRKCLSGQGLGIQNDSLQQQHRSYSQGQHCTSNANKEPARLPLLQGLFLPVCHGAGDCQDRVQASKEDSIQQHLAYPWRKRQRCQVSTQHGKLLGARLLAKMLHVSHLLIPKGASTDRCEHKHYSLPSCEESLRSCLWVLCLPRPARRISKDCRLL